MLLKLVWVTVKVLLAICAVFAVFIYFSQDGMIYFPKKYEDFQLKNLRKAGGKELEFETSQGKQVAYFLPPREPGSDRIWIVSGGNGAAALDYLDIMEAGDPKHGFLFVDYPGYGKSAGKPTPKRVRECTTGAIEALAGLLGKDTDELGKQMGAFGHSIGCAAVLRAAADFGMRRAVIVAPFTSMIDMARRQVGTPLCYVLRHRYDNRKSLTEFEKNGGKVIAFHGDRDRHVPISMSRTLKEEFPNIFTLHEVYMGDHNQIVTDITKEIAEAMAK